MENLKEIITSLKRGKVRPKVCPRCGSVDVSVLTMAGYISPPTYLCNSCGFQGNIFLEIEREGGKGEGNETKERTESGDH
ncbi:MAG: hypothetical protein H5T34_05655 [Candidatus Methanomethyliales bacterium]|nr:hypothetical protein [Candidatus Methanomethylicales archaeon]